MEIQENKYAFVIGHDEKDKGAFSSYLDIQEWSLFNNFAKAFLVEVGDIFTHDKTISSYTQRQVNTAQKTADYQYSFELHFNAANPQANGKLEELLNIARKIEYLTRPTKVAECD